MRALSHMGRVMAVVLIVLGIAVLVRTLAAVGVSQLALGHFVGVGLIGAGIARLWLQGMLDDDGGAGGRDGRAS